MLEFDLRFEAGHYKDRQTSSPPSTRPPFSVVQLAFDFGFQLYSYRGSRIRVRHGLHVGLSLAIVPNCEDTDTDSYCGWAEQNRNKEKLPHAAVHALDISVLLAGGFWVELSLANAGFPNIFFFSLGIRWEVSVGR
jgi:hypothetical protein